MKVLTKDKPKKDSKGVLPQISFNAWIEAIHSYQLDKEEPIPEGGITLEQFTKLVGRHTTTASNMLHKLIATGRAKRVPVRRACASGQIKMVPYFVLSKKP